METHREADVTAPSPPVQGPHCRSVGGADNVATLSTTAQRRYVTSVAVEDISLNSVAKEKPKPDGRLCAHIVSGEATQRTSATHAQLMPGRSVYYERFCLNGSLPPPSLLLTIKQRVPSLTPSGPHNITMLHSRCITTKATRTISRYFPQT